MYNIIKIYKSKDVEICYFLTFAVTESVLSYTSVCSNGMFFTFFDNKLIKLIRLIKYINYETVS